jgi:hypothetical protein
LRVLCGYTSLHPETRATLPDGAEVVWTGTDDLAYWQAISERWDGTQDLVVIEHDIVIHDQVIPQFMDCPSPWCTFPYFYGPDHDPSRVMYQALGCAKFSAECQARFPVKHIASSVSARDGVPPVPPWHSCDTYITRALIYAGIQTCLHEPWVTHHGTY